MTEILQPQSSPIWFIWDVAPLWLRSQAQAGKVRNITANPRVASTSPTTGTAATSSRSRAPPRSRPNRPSCSRRTSPSTTKRSVPPADDDTASAALDELAAALPEPIVSMSLRAWPLDFPDDIAIQRRPPYESRADSIMYRQVLAELAQARGWAVYLYNAKDVEDEAVSILTSRANEVLHGPRATLGPPWSKDHRVALAATIVAV